MSKKKPIIAGVVLIVSLLLVGSGLWYVKWSRIQADAAKPPMMPVDAVDIVSAETVTWFPTKKLVGTVVAKRSVSVANEVAGVVTEIGFESGDEVQPGHVLVKLDTTTELADLASAQAAERVAVSQIEVAKADIEVSQSELELARSNQRRFQEASTSVSAAELDRANADVQKAESDLERQTATLGRAQAELEQAQARVRQIQTIIDKKTLRSPFRARASMRTVHHGQYLAEGTAIVNLTEITDDIYLDFAVPQEYVDRVRPGLTVFASSKVLGESAVKITVLSMDATVNPVTRNVRVRSSVADPEHRLKQGMFIDVEVPVEAPQEFVAIPVTAVRRAAFGDHVYTVAPNDPAKNPPHAPQAMVAAMRMVTLGPDIGGKVLVLSGLKAGEKLAGSGAFKLREGRRVESRCDKRKHRVPAARA